MVSGSDQHGTPITVRAEQEGARPPRSPPTSTRSSWTPGERLGISFDLYTTTGTENHAQRRAGHLPHACWRRATSTRTAMRLPYCTVERALPARPLRRGHLPHLRLRRRPRRPVRQLRQRPRPGGAASTRAAASDGSTPEVRESEHFFLRLSAYNDRLKAWLSEGKEHWRKNVLNFSLGVLQQGLRDRAITRDLEWGIAIPLAGLSSRSGSTSGSRTLSATSPPPRSGRSAGASRRPGATSGRSPAARATTSSARTTSGSTP